MKITIVLALTALILLSACGSIFASENDIGYSKIHPASYFYFLKTIRENFELKFAGTPRVRMFRQLEFATRRLREAKTLIQINQDLIPPTLERYKVQLNSLPDQNLKNEEIETSIKNNLVVHLEVLLKMYDQVSNLRSKMAIRSTVNRIIQRADVPTLAKLPVCNFFTEEASGSALNQTEKVVLMQRAEECFKSLRL